jgi:hypothetical protein
LNPGDFWAKKYAMLRKATLVITAALALVTASIAGNPDGTSVDPDADLSSANLSAEQLTEYAHSDAQIWAESHQGAKGRAELQRVGLDHAARHHLLGGQADRYVREFSFAADAILNGNG